MTQKALNIHHIMRGLVEEVGCYDAVVEILATRGAPGACRATLSRKMNRSQSWTHEDTFALQDALGLYPANNFYAHSSPNGGARSCVSISDASGQASKECGEAISYALAASRSKEAGDLAQARKEAVEAKEAMERLIATIDAQAGREVRK